MEITELIEQDKQDLQSFKSLVLPVVDIFRKDRPYESIV